MTFLVRRIALKANGEQIVRPVTIEGDTLTIGRDASCDVHLPDLAVDPRHARATIRDGELIFESIGDQPFEVNGRSVNRRAVDLVRGAELRFGGHRITVERGEDGGPVVSVRRVEAISDASEDKDLGTVYTLKGLLPGKRLTAWAFAMIIVLVCLAWPVGAYMAHKGEEKRAAGYHGDEIWSSGDLILAHKSLKDDCQVCHVDAFVAVRDAACLSCHEDDAHAHIANLPEATATERLVAARGSPGLFGTFGRAVAEGFNRPAGRCVECHIEHTGASAMEDTPQEFCTGCHDGMSTRLTDTKLPDASDFGTEHPRFHPALMVKAGKNPVYRREVLTNASVETNGLKFTHAQHMGKSGGVAQMVRRRPAEFGGRTAMRCADCHTPDATNTRFEPVKMEDDCQTCHALGLELVNGTARTLRHGEPELVAADLRAYYRAGTPPRPESLSGFSRRPPGDGMAESTARDFALAVQFFPTRADGAVTKVFSKGGACYDCHVVTRGGKPITNGFAIVPAAQTRRYLTKGWFTHDAHTKYECTDCHVEALSSDDARRVLIPGLGGQGGCRDCHVGGTGASLQPVDHPVESDCAMCHDYHADNGPPFMSNASKTVADADRRKRVSVR